MAISRRDGAAPRRRHLRSGRSRQRSNSRLPAARHVSRRPRRRYRRSVPLRARHHRLRPVPLRRGQSHAHLRQARRAPDDDRSTRRASTSPSGPPTPRASASSATSTPGTAASTRCARLGVERRVGDLHSGSAVGHRYKFELRDAARRTAAQVRSLRLRVRGAAAVGVDRLRAATTSGATPQWMA